MIRNWRLLLLGPLTAVVLGLAVSAVQPTEFAGRFRVLIVPKGSLDVDAYTAARQAERLAAIMRQIIYSRAFLQNLPELREGYADLTSASDEELMKAFKARTSAFVDESSGAVTFEIRHAGRLQALTLATQAQSALNNLYSDYFGGRGVELKTLDAPEATQDPVSPRPLRNAFVGYVAGWLLILTALYLLDARARQEPLISIMV